MRMERPATTWTPGSESAAAAPTTDRRSADRRRRRSFVLRERRSGFDRRLPDVHTGGLGGLVHYGLSRLLVLLRDRSAVLVAVLVAMNVLSVTDLALTVAALDRGAVELNPVIRPLLDQSPWLAAAAKALLVGAATLLIWRFRRYRMILQVALIGVAFFGLIVAYQVVFGFLL
jgi:hypothetical protein